MYHPYKQDLDHGQRQQEWKSRDSKTLSDLPKYHLITREKAPESYVPYDREAVLEYARMTSSDAGRGERRPQFFTVNHVETIHAPSFFETEYVPKDPSATPSDTLKDNLVLNLSKIRSGESWGNENSREVGKKVLDYYRDLIFFRGRTLDGGRPVYGFVDYDDDDYGPRIYLEAREGFDIASYAEESRVTERLVDRNCWVSEMVGEEEWMRPSGPAKFVRWLQNYMFSKICDNNANGKYQNRDSFKNYDALSEGEDDSGAGSGGGWRAGSTLVDPWTIKSFLFHHNRKGIKTIYGYIPEPENKGPDRYVLQLNLTTKAVAKRLHEFFESETYLNLAASGVVPTIRTFEASVTFDDQWRQEFDIQISNCYQTANYRYAMHKEIVDTFLDYGRKKDPETRDSEDVEKNCNDAVYIVLGNERSLARMRDEDFLNFLRKEPPEAVKEFSEVIKGTVKIPTKNKECTSFPFTASKPLVCAFDIETNTRVDAISGKTLFSVAKWTPEAYADRFKFLLSTNSKAEICKFKFYEVEEARNRLAQLAVRDSKSFLLKRFSEELRQDNTSFSEDKKLENILLSSALPKKDDTDECTIICFVFRKNETGTELASKNGAYCFTWLPKGRNGGDNVDATVNFENITKASHGYFANSKCEIFSSELEMIEAFVRTVRENNADIYLGHNIMEFDMRYLVERVQLLKEKRNGGERKGVSLPHFSFGCLLGRKDKHYSYSFTRNKGQKTTHNIKSSGITILDTVHCVRNDNFGKKNFDMPFTLACLMFSVLKYPGSTDVLRKLEVDITKCREMWRKAGVHLSYLVGYCLFDAVGSAMLAEMENYLETMFIVSDITSTGPSEVFMKGAQNVVSHCLRETSWTFGKKYIIPDYGRRELHWPDLWYDHVYQNKIQGKGKGEYEYKDVRELYETSFILKRKWENGCIREIPDYRKKPKDVALRLNPFFPMCESDSTPATRSAPLSSEALKEIFRRHEENSAALRNAKKNKKGGKGAQTNTIDKYMIGGSKSGGTECEVGKESPQRCSQRKEQNDEPIAPAVANPYEKYVYSDEEKILKQKKGLLPKTKGYMGGNVLPTFRGFFSENLEEIEDFVSQYPTIICDYCLDFCTMVTENMKIAFDIPGYHLTRGVLGPEHLTHMGNVFQSKTHADLLGYTSPSLAYIYYYQNLKDDELVLVNIIRKLLAFRAESKKRKAYWVQKYGKLRCIHTIYNGFVNSTAEYVFCSSEEAIAFFRDKIKKNKANDFGGASFIEKVLDTLSNGKSPEMAMNEIYKFANASTDDDKKYDPLRLDEGDVIKEYVTNQLQRGGNIGRENSDYGRIDGLMHKAMERKFLALVLRAQKEAKNSETEQVSIKLVANSHYGVISASKSHLPQQTLGSFITCEGRKHSECSANISENNDLIELARMEKSGNGKETALVLFEKEGIFLEKERKEGENFRKKVVAGDTDSVMVLIPSVIKNTRKLALLYKQTLGNIGLFVINDLLPKMPKDIPRTGAMDKESVPLFVIRNDRKNGEMKMELEKINIRVLKARKKNYVADSLEETSLSLKGVSAKKSDTLVFAASLEKKLYEIIFEDDEGKTSAKDKIVAAINRARMEIVNILDGKYDPVDFVMMKKMDKPVEAYQSTSGTRKLPEHVEVARKKLKRNEKVFPGDKIRYVYVENSDSTYVDTKYLSSALCTMKTDSEAGGKNNIEEGGTADKARFAKYIEKINDKALREGIVAEDADYAFSKGLPLDVLYYLQIKLLKELSKFFAPFLCKMLEWKVRNFGESEETSGNMKKNQKKNQTADERKMYEMLTHGNIKERMQMLLILRLQRQIIRFSTKENKFYMPKTMIRRCVNCNGFFSVDSDHPNLEHSAKKNFLDEKRNGDGFYSVCPACEKKYPSNKKLGEEYSKKIEGEKKKFAECEEKCWKCIENCGVAALVGKEKEIKRENRFYTQPKECTLSYCQIYREKKFVRFRINKLVQDSEVVKDHIW